MRKNKRKETKTTENKKKRHIPAWIWGVTIYLLVLAAAIILLEKHVFSNYISGNKSIFISISVGMMVTSVLILLGKNLYRLIWKRTDKRISSVFEFIKMNTSYKALFAIGLFLFIAVTNIEGKKDFADLETTVKTLISIIESAAQPFVIVTLVLAVIQKYNVWFEMKPKTSDSDVAIAIMDEGNVKAVKKYLEDMKLNIPIHHIDIKNQIDPDQMEDLKGAIAKVINTSKAYNPSNVHLFIKGPIILGTMVGAMASNNLNINLYHWNNNMYQPYGRVAHNTFGANVNQKTFEVMTINGKSD